MKSLALAALALALASGSCASPAPAPPAFDVVIRGGLLVDGSGAPGRRADLGILGGRIAAVGELAAPGREEVNAAGRVVSPGFVDLHSHADGGILQFRDAENYIRQGVTTLLCGNCGMSPTDFAGFFRRLREGGTGPNIALLIGHGSVRAAVVGNENVAAAPAQRERMGALIRSGMEAGAVGLSTSLRYGTGAYAPTEEIVEMAAAVAPYGGLYATHMRDEGSRILEALEEALRIGREAGVPVEVSHHKISSASAFGRTRETLAMIDRARAGGADVMLDQYPYGAGSSAISLCVPQTSLSGGLAAFRERVSDPARRAAILEAVEGFFVEKLFEAGQSPGEAGRAAAALARIQIARAAHDPKLEGRNLAQILESRGTPLTLRNGAELVVELVAQGVSAIYHTIDDRPGGDVDRVMRHPMTSIASDGSVFEFGSGNPHPRSYGCFPRLLARYVRERKLLTLEQAVHKMTGLPARRLGWTDRGTLAPGRWADVVVFDPATVEDRATFLEPHRHSAGVEHVLVRGRFVLKAGAMTGARPGRPIASVPAARTPETILRRDLLAILEEQDGETGLHVALEDGRWEFAINAEIPFEGRTLRQAAREAARSAGATRLRRIRLQGRAAVLGLAASGELPERLIERVVARLQKFSPPD
jgi:dihydroorotase/N-acyl-D-amino-acid deacylase